MTGKLDTAGVAELDKANRPRPATLTDYPRMHVWDLRPSRG